MIAAWRMSLDGRRLPLDDPPVSDWLRGELERLRARPDVLWDADPEALGEAFDRGMVAAVWCAVSSVVEGDGESPIGGRGVALMVEAWRLQDVGWRNGGADLVIEGSVRPTAAGNPDMVKKEDRR